MSDETKTMRAPRAPRGSIQHGLRAMCFLCIPVPKDNLREALKIEEAFLEATSTGDMSKLLELPGIRIARTERKHTFGPLPKVGETAGKSEGGEDDQAEIEDAIREGQEGEAEGETGDGEGETEAPASGRRNRRAA